MEIVHGPYKPVTSDVVIYDTVGFAGVIYFSPAFFLLLYLTTITIAPPSIIRAMITPMTIPPIAPAPLIKRIIWNEINVCRL